MALLKTLSRVLFPVDMDKIFSDENMEKAAIVAAARFSRGNTRVQSERVTTDRMFGLEMECMENRVARAHGHSR